METRVYAMLWAKGEAERLAALEAALPPERRARRKDADPSRRAQANAAWALLRCALWEKYGMETLPPLCYGPFGKPAFRDGKDIFFNLSHTDGLALCAVGSCAVGVDAERIRALPQGRAERLRLQAEPKDFFQGWVERESRIKRRGESAILCRRAVEAPDRERYVPLDMGKEYAAGIALDTLSTLRVFSLSPEELEERLPRKKSAGIV